MYVFALGEGEGRVRGAFCCLHDSDIGWMDAGKGVGRGVRNGICRVFRKERGREERRGICMGRSRRREIMNAGKGEGKGDDGLFPCLFVICEFIPAPL